MTAESSQLRRVGISPRRRIAAHDQHRERDPAAAARGRARRGSSDSRIQHPEHPQITPRASHGCVVIADASLSSTDCVADVRLSIAALPDSAVLCVSVSPCHAETARRDPDGCVASIVATQAAGVEASVTRYVAGQSAT